MIIYSGMGWIVPIIWFIAIGVSGKLAPDFTARLGLALSPPAFVFLLGAAISAPLTFIAGTLLNRHKEERTIIRFGTQKSVRWGRHTLYLLPVEYWAVVIPVATVIGYSIVSLV